MVEKLCNLPSEEDYCRVQGGEAQCDGFHDELDKLLVETCLKEVSFGDMEWILDCYRTKNVVELASSPSQEIYIGEHNGTHPGEYCDKRVLTLLATTVENWGVP